jgi:hypothetical protein
VATSAPAHGSCKRLACPVARSNQEANGKAHTKQPLTKGGGAAAR